MNESGQAGFEDVARDARREMFKLTPGQRIKRALELAELGTRLQQAARTAVKRTAPTTVNEPRGTDYKTR